MASHVWLSFPLGIEDPRPPAIPAPELSTLYTIAEDDASVHVLKVASHTGTHVDAPRHVVADGLTIHDFAPEEFIFTRPAVIDIEAADDAILDPDDLEKHADRMARADIALLRFGYGRVRRDEPERFTDHCPGLSVAAGQWLKEGFPELRAVGMDVPSLACIAHLDETMACHNALLEGAGRRFLVVEDMNLARDLTGLCEVRLNPWLVSGMDSAPCSVLGVLE